MTSSRAFRKLVIGIPAPRRDHRQDEASALLNQFAIRSGVGLADGLRDVCEIELDRPAATRLEIDEQQPCRSAQDVPWVWFAMQQLLA